MRRLAVVEDGAGRRVLNLGSDVTSDLSWSPDGRLLVFGACATNQGGRQQLYTVNVRTHAVKRLTNLPQGASYPVWSPNGRWIAFVGADAHDTIYLLSPRTHRTHELRTKAGNAVGGLGAAWSPDSRRLAFNAHGKITVIGIDGLNFHSLGVWGDQPSWSPEGQWLVYCDGDYVRVIRTNGTDERRIFYGNSQKLRNFGPVWGP